MSTGASRDTREISPYTNSSATRSPSTVIVTLGNASIIFRSRSTSFKCFVIRRLEQTCHPEATCVSSPKDPGEPREASRSLRCNTRAFGSLPYRPRIFSRAPPPLLNHAQHGIHTVSCVGQLHLHRNHRQRRQRVKISTQVHRILLCSNKASSLTALPELQQITNIFVGIRMMVAKKCLGYGIN